MKISGRVVRALWSSEDGSYHVMALDPFGDCPDGLVNKYHNVSITGPLGHLKVGDDVELDGEPTQSAKYGAGLKVRSAVVINQSKDTIGIANYLQRHITALGDVLAIRVAETFGSEIEDILDNHPERLLEIADIGPERYKAIIDSWEADRGSRQLNMFLAEIGLGTKYLKDVKLLLDPCGLSNISDDDIVAKIRENPYILVDIPGIGFRRADDCASRMGIDPLSPLRLSAGVVFILLQNEAGGHCYMTVSDLYAQSHDILRTPGITLPMIHAALADTVSKNKVVTFSGRYYLANTYAAEQTVAREMRNMLAEQLMLRVAPQEIVDAGICNVESRMGYSLDESQRAAVLMACRSRLSVITGGPGVGKTTIINAVAAVTHSMGETVRLLAPTGRAAKCMATATGLSAITIHRYVGWGTSAYGNTKISKSMIPQLPEDTVVETDDADESSADKDHDLHRAGGVIIVDEMSMTDIFVLSMLMENMSSTVRLLLVGDYDQLPSVGPGAVLRDVIDSGAVPVTRLTRVYRQSAIGGITQNAHRINNGQLPELPAVSSKDGIPDTEMMLAHVPDPEQAQQAVVWCATVLADRFGIRREDCHVMSPMRKGPLGTIALNTVLQQAMNPSPAISTKRFDGTIWAPGDKLINTKNNYELGLMNGEIGILEDLEYDEEALEGLDYKAKREKKKTMFPKALRLKLPDKTMIIPVSYWNPLYLAYATTVHKAQGAQFDMVVVALHDKQHRMLQRNLLYTAVTRAKKKVVIVGTPSAIATAVHNNEIIRRNTSLRELLCGAPIQDPAEEQQNVDMFDLTGLLVATPGDDDDQLAANISFDEEQ